MIKAELRSENTFCFTINASIFNERVLTKALYCGMQNHLLFIGIKTKIIYLK